VLKQPDKHKRPIIVPVNAAPTEENANDLERRLEFLEEEILKTDLG
jgi:hypothetical protein